MVGPGGQGDLPVWSEAQAADQADQGAALLQRLLLGDAPLLGQWLAGDPEGTTEAETAPEETDEEETQLEAVTPDKIQERTITGGSGYTTGGGVTIFNRTEKAVDLDEVGEGGTSLSFSDPQDGPQVLILHTHGTESFARDGTEPYTETGTAHTTDENYNIIRVGDEIERIFTEMGISVLHDRNYYDYPSYNGAYERARAAAEEILAENPTIQMVLDVHRDALVGEDGTIYKPVLTVDGAKTAQVMLLVGTDDGGASFPDWEEHLALAMDLYGQMNSLWPGLARPITLRTARFNEQLTKGSLLVEVGSHGNTLEEALAGARLFARVAGQEILSRTAAG
jgi:stage II sporulation protein P